MTESAEVADSEAIRVTLSIHIECGDGQFEAIRENNWHSPPQVGDVLLVPIWEGFESDETCISKVVRISDTGHYWVSTSDLEYPEDWIKDVSPLLESIGFEVSNVEQPQREPTEYFGRWHNKRHQFESIEEMAVESSGESLFWAFDDHAGIFRKVDAPVSGKQRDRYPEAAGVPSDVQDSIVKRHLHRLRVSGKLSEIVGETIMSVSCAVCSPEGEELSRFVRPVSRVPTIGETIDVGTQYMCRVTNVTHTDPACGVVAKIMVLPMEHLLASDRHQVPSDIQLKDEADTATQDENGPVDSQKQTTIRCVVSLTVEIESEKRTYVGEVDCLTVPHAGDWMTVAGDATKVAQVWHHLQTGRIQICSVVHERDVAGFDELTDLMKVHGFVWDESGNSWLECAYVTDAENSF